MKITSFGTKKAVMIPSPLLPLIVATAQWVCFTSFVCRYESKSSADDSNYSPWNQIAQKIGDWLTEAPVYSMVVGLDFDTNRHGISIPQGWITPTTYLQEGGINGRTKRLSICSDLW
jgi:hypothetical protein